MKDAGPASVFLWVQDISFALEHLLSGCKSLLQAVLTNFKKNGSNSRFLFCSEQCQCLSLCSCAFGSDEISSLGCRLVVGMGEVCVQGRVVT